MMQGNLKPKDKIEPEFSGSTLGLFTEILWIVQNQILEAPTRSYIYSLLFHFSPRTS